MKMNNVLTVGAALMLAPLTSTLAQSAWETVDALTPAMGCSIFADSNGNFLSFANDYTIPTNGISDVSVSTDHGLTWQTITQIPMRLLRPAQGLDGTLYASGSYGGPMTSSVPHATVWQSLDHGATWAALSNPWAGQYGSLAALGLGVGASGAVYLSGNGNNTWFVRKGVPTPSGYSWSTADTYSGNGGPYSVYVRPATAAGQTDEVFVAGAANNHWTVRHSANGGATWATLDSYNPGMSGQAKSITVGPDGTIWVAGAITTLVNKTNQTGWLVRKSSNGGASWTNVDYVINGSPAACCGVHVDVFGRVFVVGNAPTAGWTVRGSTDGGATWTTTDAYTSSTANSVASDALGNVCVTGYGSGGLSSLVAPIRRLAAQ